MTWLDLTAADRDKMRRMRDLFKAQGARDEMGLGSPRNVLSNALFPGTSRIQTRVAVLSRNLTFDRSWDVALASEAPLRALWSCACVGAF